MLFRCILLAVLISTTTREASAMLGSNAARGDNCTPFNSFKIGYGVPRGTIVDQSVVLVDGWLTAGWILGTSSGTRYYLPNPRFFDHSIDEYGIAAGPPAFVVLEPSRPDALKNAYRLVRAQRKEYARHHDSDAPYDLPPRTFIARCYSKALRI
jgi:hypothetical protein